jgi:hypothetical protein
MSNTKLMKEYEKETLEFNTWLKVDRSHVSGYVKWLENKYTELLEDYEKISEEDVE